MVTKGLLQTEPIHGVKTFRPQHAKLETMALLIRDFATNILCTDGPIPIAAFSQSKLLDQSEIADLETLLEELDAEQKDRRR